MPRIKTRNQRHSFSRGLDYDERQTKTIRNTDIFAAYLAFIAKNDMEKDRYIAETLQTDVKKWY